MSSVRFPQVELVLPNGTINELRSVSFNHFKDDSYVKFLILGDYAEFDRFVSALEWALEEVSDEENVQQLRKFSWAGHRLQVLSVRNKHLGLVTLHKISSCLQSVEAETLFEIRNGTHMVKFPYPVVNLHVMNRWQRRR